MTHLAYYHAPIGLFIIVALLVVLLWPGSMLGTTGRYRYYPSSGLAIILLILLVLLLLG